MQVFEWVMCSEERKDAHRFRDIILAAQEAGEAKKHKQFRPWSEKVAKQPRPKHPLTPSRTNAAGPGKDAEKQLIAQIRYGCGRPLSVYAQQYPCLPIMSVLTCGSVSANFRLPCLSANAGWSACIVNIVGFIQAIRFIAGAICRGNSAARADKAFAALEAKYCGKAPKRKQGSAAAAAEPSEEKFAKLKREVMDRKTKRKGST